MKLPASVPSAYRQRRPLPPEHNHPPPTSSSSRHRHCTFDATRRDVAAVSSLQGDGLWGSDTPAPCATVSADRRQPDCRQVTSPFDSTCLVACRGETSCLRRRPDRRSRREAGVRTRRPIRFQHQRRVLGRASTALPARLIAAARHALVSGRDDNAAGWPRGAAREDEERRQAASDMPGRA